MTRWLATGGSRFILVDHGPKATKDKTLFEPNRLVAREWAGSVHTSLPGDEIKLSSFWRYLTSQTRKEKTSYLQMPCIMYKLCIIMTIVVIDSTLYDIISSLLEPHLEVLCQEMMDI